MELIPFGQWIRFAGWARYDIATRAEIFMPDNRRLFTIDINSDTSGNRETWMFGGGIEGTDEGIEELRTAYEAFDFEGGSEGNPGNDLRFKLPLQAVDNFEPDWLGTYQPGLPIITTAYTELNEEAAEHGLPPELAALIQFENSFRHTVAWQLRYSYLGGVLERMPCICYDYFVRGFVPPQAAEAVEAAVYNSRYLELVTDDEIAAGVTYSGTPISEMCKLVLS